MRTAWRTGRRGLYLLCSVRVANGLLIAIALAGLIGIVVAQFGTLTLASPELYAAAVQKAAERYGQPLATIGEQFGLYRVFTTGWFGLLVILFTASAIGNTVMRLPRVARDIRRPMIRRGRRYFRAGLPGRTGPLEGLDGRPLPEILGARRYRVVLEREGGVNHLFAERNRWSPLASLVSHGALPLFVVAMGFLTPRFGYEAHLKVPVGEIRPILGPGAPGNLLVGNESFVARFNESGQPVDYRTMLTIYRDGQPVARKEILVNDPLSVGGYTFHQNFFGPAVELVVRDAAGILFDGPVLLDGQLGGKPEGVLAIPGSDVSLELLLAKGAGGVAELTVIGVRPAPSAASPDIVFGAVLQTGDEFAPDTAPIRVGFVRPSSYIGLIVKHDPGQGLVWLGAVLLVAGLTISLGLPRSRVWARYDGSAVRMAIVGGSPFAATELERIVAALPRLDAGPEYLVAGATPRSVLVEVCPNGAPGAAALKSRLAVVTEDVADGPGDLDAGPAKEDGYAP